MSFVPETPGGTLVFGLAADTEEEAIRRLLIDAAHMPYKTWPKFQKRGYSIVEIKERPAENPPLYTASGLSQGEGSGHE